MNRIKFSTNPYNINRLTMAAGIAAMEDEKYYREKCREIMENRAYTAGKLKELGFTVLPSDANFLFAGGGGVSGLALYEGLKKRGVLVRHFEKERIRDFNRITIGTRRQMDTLLAAVEEILEEKQ